MIIDEEVYLEHFGVKGMRWGVRRSPEKRLQRLNADSAMAGMGIRGYYAQKLANKILKKDPTWSTKKFKQLPQEEQDKYMRKISRRAYAGVIARGALEVGAILGGRAILKSQVPMTPVYSRGLNQVTGFMGGSVGLARLGQIKSIHDANQLDKLRKEVHGR